MTTQSQTATFIHAEARAQLISDAAMDTALWGSKKREHVYRIALEQLRDMEAQSKSSKP